jgi:hypothetical protein
MKYYFKVFLKSQKIEEESNLDQMLQNVQDNDSINLYILSFFILLFTNLLNNLNNTTSKKI